MTDLTTEARRIAAGLTKAQRATVKDVRAAYEATKAIAEMYQEGLVSIEGEDADLSVELTPLGLAVRAILTEGEGCGEFAK